jgi:hypothetical protein
MDSVNLKMLHDISVWEEESGKWMRWNFGNPLKPLQPLVPALSQALSIVTLGIQVSKIVGLGRLFISGQGWILIIVCFSSNASTVPPYGNKFGTVMDSLKLISFVGS